MRLWFCVCKSNERISLSGAGRTRLESIEDAKTNLSFKNLKMDDSFTIEVSDFKDETITRFRNWLLRNGF
jgi:hypothetical protein